MLFVTGISGRGIVGRLVVETGIAQDVETLRKLGGIITVVRDECVA